ncbi:MAG TPA: hypothetical protein VGM98_11675 [Schlesneria sp.]|jgi:hypothetical protein
MDQSDDAARPGKRRTNAGTASKRSRKKRTLAWYQHVSIVVPLAACAIFAVLIGGTLTVRRIIYRVEKSADPTSIFPSASGEPLTAAPKSQTEATITAEAPTVAEPLPSQALLTAAPAADQKEGVRLSRTLLVGSGNNMLPTICDALNVAEPGDAIEVRTNGPLLELGTQLLRKTRVADAPITVRNGDGFQPIVRLGKQYAPFVKSKNVDLTFAGLHFVNHYSGVFSWIEQGNVAFSNCSFSNRRSLMGSQTVWLTNPAGMDSFHAMFDHCFLRNSTFGMQNGTKLSFVASECAAITWGGNSHFNFRGDTENLVSIGRCTLLNGVVVVAAGKFQQWPTPPLKYQLNQTILGVSGGNPTVIAVLQRDEDRATSAGQALSRLNSWVGFEGEGSVRQLNIGYLSPALTGLWGYVDNFQFQDASRLPELPKNDSSLTFGAGVEEMRRLQAIGKYDLARELGGTLLPDQLAVSSTGALAELRAAGIQVGCDVTRLPVPPAATLELYPPAP